MPCPVPDRVNVPGQYLKKDGICFTDDSIIETFKKAELVISMTIKISTEFGNVEKFEVKYPSVQELSS